MVKFLDQLVDEVVLIGVPVTRVTRTDTRRETPKPVLGTVQIVHEEEVQCPMRCGDRHLLQHCVKFIESDINGRRGIVDRLRRCRGCLGPHFIREYKTRQLLLTAAPQRTIRCYTTRTATVRTLQANC